MKKTLLWAMAGLCVWAFTACDPNTPQEPEPAEKEDTIPASFPKKQLIEEFTGQGCGYCPYGMDCIHNFIDNDTNYVLILHHYGYAKDRFSVSESKTITDALKVDGAPNMAINRAKTQYKDENNRNRSMVVLHPAYLETTDPAQFETETYASVNIRNTYDADTRHLAIHVSGAVTTPDVPDLQLTVLVKESGMIDTQADYLSTFEGWEEFRHTNAVRAFLTKAKGDSVTIQNQRYSATFDLTLEDKWVAENCMVVAFLSEAFQPVVQVEQKPVVEGTKGGADITHGGITPVPVPDYYPEPSATAAPNTSAPLTVTQAGSTKDGNRKYWTIMSYNANVSISISGTACIPFTYIYLVTSADETSIPTGTYEINSTGEIGTVIAGYRDDERLEVDGSIYYLTSKSYFTQGYLSPKEEWLITDGTMTITEEGWELTGHVRNGSDIHLVGSTAIQLVKAPAKMKRK